MLAAGAALFVYAAEVRAGDAAQDTPGDAVKDAAGDVVAGEKRYLASCVNCHGKTGKGMASFPSIAGRDVGYISERLTAYRAEKMVGPNSAIMMSQAEGLSDADIANLAAYISTTFQ
jgi:cytochrome c553